MPTSAARGLTSALIISRRNWLLSASGDANFRAAPISDTDRIPIVLAVLPDGIRTHTTQRTQVLKRTKISTSCLDWCKKRKQQQTNDPARWILSEMGDPQNSSVLRNAPCEARGQFED